MFSHPIVKTYIILSAVVASVYTKKQQKPCIAFKDSNFCNQYSISKKTTYVSPFFYTDITDGGIDDIKDFNKAMQKLDFNPIYPTDPSYLFEEFGCNYDVSKFEMRYVNSYQCNFLFHQKDSSCNNNVKDKLPKLCKNSCLIYLDNIKSIFNNTETCPLTSEEDKLSKRQKKLEEIEKHCLEYTSEDDSCLIGVDSEHNFCGYKIEDEFNEYCNAHLNDPCCSINTEDSGDKKLLKIGLYIFIGVAVLLVVVLMALKLYSVNKNRRDKASRSKTQEIEKRREAERDKYREQLSKEASNESLSMPLLHRNSSNSPLLHRNSSNSPYLGQRRPPPPTINNTPFPQRSVTKPESEIRPPPPAVNSPLIPERSITKPEFPQRNGTNGSLPPQHQGSRDAPRHSPSHHPQYNNMQPRNNQNHPPQNKPYPGPVPSSRPSVNGPRDSPRNGPSRPPAPGVQPRGSGHHPQNRPPQPFGTRQYSQNNNRY